MEAFWLGLMAGGMAALPLGAMAVLLMETALRRGLFCGLAGGLGVLSADVLYATLAVIVGAAVEDLLLPYRDLIAIIVGMVILTLGLTGLRAHRRQSVSHPNTPVLGLTGTYFKFLALTLINPAIVVFFLTIIVTADIQDIELYETRMLFVLGVLAGSAFWQSVLIAIGAFGSERLEETMQRKISFYGMCIITLFGIFAVLFGAARWAGIISSEIGLM